jgi:hypothetical protein
MVASSFSTGPAGDRGALRCHWKAIAAQPIGLVPFQARGILPVAEEQSRTRGGQSGGVTHQPQCRGLWHSSSLSARSLSRSPSSPPPSFTQSFFPPRSIVRDGQTSPHRPWLVVSRSTCPPLSPSAHTNSFVIGTAVINAHTHVPKRFRYVRPVQTGISAIPNLEAGKCHCGGGADRAAAFGVAGPGQRRRLAGTTSRSPSTTHVPSNHFGRNRLARSALLPRHTLHPHKRSRGMASLRCFRGSRGDRNPKRRSNQTAHSFRSDTRTPLPSLQQSTQVRYCRYSRLHRSEIPKCFLSSAFQIFGLGFRSTLQRGPGQKGFGISVSPLTWVEADKNESMLMHERT